MLFWTALSAIATAIGVVLVLVGSYLAFRQLREAARARQLEATLMVLRYLESADFREVRAAMRGDLSIPAIRKLMDGDPDTQAIDRRLKAFTNDRVGWEDLRAYMMSVEHISILTG